MMHGPINIGLVFVAQRVHQTISLYGHHYSNFVVDTAGGKEAEGVSEHGVEENIWT